MMSSLRFALRLFLYHDGLSAFTKHTKEKNLRALRDLWRSDLRGFAHHQAKARRPKTAVS
jgi:hypothetical protein